MAERKPIPKSVRFDVFKRDSFKCQYCGRSAPDVILEVDHIVPVAEGGTNDPLNLVTSCRDCNRGKSAKLLSDTTIIDKQRKQLEDMNEMREQTEMLIQWKQELLTMSETQVDAIDALIEIITGWSLSDIGRRNIKNHIRRFGFENVYSAAEISFYKYYNDDNPDYTFSLAVNKIGGICYNKAKHGKSDSGAE